MSNMSKERFCSNTFCKCRNTIREESWNPPVIEGTPLHKSIPRVNSIRKNLHKEPTWEYNIALGLRSQRRGCP